MNGNRRKTRRHNEKPRRQSAMVLIMGDGDSEKRYFERLSDLCGTVSIKMYATGKNGLDTILRKTGEHVSEHRIDPSEGDIVAIVMDLDGRFSESEVLEMERRCGELGYRLFVSNPCFETWLLCHFRIPIHPCDQNGAVEELEGELGGRYVKSRGFDIDDGMVDKALTNAGKLFRNAGCSPTECHRHNPSTTVHVLVDAIRDMKRRRSRSYGLGRSGTADDVPYP